MARFTTTTTTDAKLIPELDAAKIGRPVAEVIRQEIAAAIRALPMAGGRRQFNRTGHLVDGLRIEPNPDGSWSVTVPPDRLEAPELMARLVALVPLIADPLSSPRVQAAIEASMAVLIGAK